MPGACLLGFTNSLNHREQLSIDAIRMDSDSAGDERLARDMQLALDLQAREERKAERRRRTGEQQQSLLEGGYTTGALNADHMLFVACTIDDRDVDMLVDTGASASAMSFEMVQRLGIESKMNASVFGNAKGVGSSKILGIVESVCCTIGHVEFRLFFMVLEGSMPYCILGLDQMRRFKCLVDLDSGALVFGGRDGVSIPFLSKEEASAVANRMIQGGGNSRNDEESKANGRSTGSIMRQIFRKS